MLQVQHHDEEMPDSCGKAVNHEQMGDAVRYVRGEADTREQAGK